MATCFMHNVYCCYLPAHCSHGLQPLDNGIFNALKTAYRVELAKLSLLSDSTPVDKVNFIRAYAKAREIGMTPKNIRSGWRVTGNWPISRRAALMHDELQADQVELPPSPAPNKPQIAAPFGEDETTKCSRQLRDFGKSKTPGTQRKWGLAAKGYEAKDQAISQRDARIASLEEELARLQRGKKKKAVPNPTCMGTGIFCGAKRWGEQKGGHAWY